MKAHRDILNWNISMQLPLVDSVHVTVPRFRVRDKEGIEDPKSQKMLIFPNNCQFGFKFWIRPDEADAFLINTHPKCSPGTRMEP